MDGGHAQGGGEVGIAGSGAPDENQVAGLIHEGHCRQLLDVGLLKGRFREDEAQQVSVQGEMSSLISLGGSSAEIWSTQVFLCGTIAGFSPAPYGKTGQITQRAHRKLVDR